MWRSPACDLQWSLTAVLHITTMETRARPEGISTSAFFSWPFITYMVLPELLRGWARCLREGTSNQHGPLSKSVGRPGPAASICLFGPEPGPLYAGWKAMILRNDPQWLSEIRWPDPHPPKSDRGPPSFGPTLRLWEWKLVVLLSLAPHYRFLLDGPRQFWHVSWTPLRLVVKNSISIQAKDRDLWQLRWPQARPTPTPNCEAPLPTQEPRLWKWEPWNRVSLGSFDFDLMEKDTCWQEIKFCMKDFPFQNFEYTKPELVQQLDGCSFTWEEKLRGFGRRSIQADLQAVPLQVFILVLCPQVLQLVTRWWVAF